MTLEYREWTVGVYDRAAPTYDHVGPRVFSHFGRRLVELAELPPGASVLDVGCGRGAVLLPAARRVGHSGCVIGIDLSSVMLAESKAEMDRLGLTNALAWQMDAEQLAFPDRCFDFVFCAFVLFMLPHLERALSESMRVLRPGGVFLASTFSKELDERWDGYRKLARAYRDRLRPAPAAETRGLRSPAELEEVLGSSGFVDVQVTAERNELCFADEREWWAFEWSQGNRSGLERLEPADLAHRQQEAFEWIQHLKGSCGIPMWMEMLLTQARKPGRV